MGLNVNEAWKQLWDWGGDYDVFDNRSFDGGVRDAKPTGTYGTDRWSSQGTNKPGYDSTGRKISTSSNQNQPLPEVKNTSSQVNNGSGSFSGGGSYAASSAAAAQEAARRAANAASRNATQQAIDSLGTELDTGRRNIHTERDAIASRYDRERGTAKKEYDDNIVTNDTNLAKNKQNSLLSAAQGLRGLRSVMASIGALSGDGGKLANRAVQTEANKDIGGAADTYAQNAQQLDKSWDKFDEEDQDRRNQLEVQRQNQETALEGKVASKRQGYLQKMADLFGEVGDAGSAQRLIGEAGGLNNEIASKTAVAAAPFQARTAAFTPGDLADYLAGAGDMTVDVVGGDSTGLAPELNTTLLAGRKKRDERGAPVAQTPVTS